jgi:hypothetical protein
MDMLNRTCKQPFNCENRAKIGMGFKEQKKYVVFLTLFAIVETQLKWRCSEYRYLSIYLDGE